MEPCDAGGVAGDAEVGVVPTQHGAEPPALGQDGVVPSLLHLQPQLLEFADQSLPLRLPFHQETPLPTHAAIVREAEKVERLGPSLTTPLPVRNSEPSELDQSGLALMQAEP